MASPIPTPFSYEEKKGDKTFNMENPYVNFLVVKLFELNGYGKKFSSQQTGSEKMKKKKKELQG